MTAADRSKWEQLIEADEQEEKVDKERKRIESRERYERTQREKQIKWEEEMRRQGKDPEVEKEKFSHSSCAFSQMSSFMKPPQANANANADAHDSHGHSHTRSAKCNHNDDHNHDHSHSHNGADTADATDNAATDAAEAVIPEAHTPQSSSQCGYMSPAQIKQMQQNASKPKAKPELTVAEKNIKKRAAVYAAKQDGNRLFTEGNYDLAFRVYERGILIINGMYDISDEVYEEMEQIESVLNLNIAALKLKQKQWTDAISNCRMALQIDKRNVKAFYRWAEALIGMGEYQEAKQQSLKAKAIMPENSAVLNQLKRIEKLAIQQKAKAKKQRELISQRMQQNQQNQKQQNSNTKNNMTQPEK